MYYFILLLILVLLLNWSPTAAAGAAVAVDGSIMRPNDPNILGPCHSVC